MTVNILLIFAKVWSRTPTTFFMPVVAETNKLQHKIDIKDYDIEYSDRQAVIFWGKNNASNFRVESLYT